MEELGQYLREKTGWSLNPSELNRLCARYLNTQSRVIDYPRLLEDIRKGVLLKEKSNFLDDSVLSKQNRHMTYEQILDILRQRINHRSECLCGEDKLKKAYLLLSESRSSSVTRQQLKIACQSRLSLFLHDHEIEEIFRQFDTHCEGKVNIRQLINVILKRDRDSMALSLQIGDNNPGNTLKNAATTSATATANAAGATTSTNLFGTTTASTPTSKGARGVRVDTFDDNQNASITYDRQIKGLKPPNPNQCKDYSIQDIEDFIWDRVFERSNLSENMVKTLTRLFSNGENTTGNHIITLDQLKYTLWKRLKLNITEDNVERFYNKYAKSPANRSKEGIDMFHFTDGIIRQRAKNQPILGDADAGSSSKGASAMGGTNMKLMSTLQKKKSIESFLILLRQQINDLINRESRAPHYLLYGNTRMTKDQAKQFLQSKLRLSLDSFPRYVVDEIYQEYDLNGLVDTKRMIMEAMAMKEEQIPRAAGDEEVVGKLPHQTLLNGALVSVDKMPTSLIRSSLTPDKIEEMLVKKCMERLKDDHPHASLHRVFRDAGEADARFITRKGMKSVLHRFDIIMSNDEFEAFFSKHDTRHEGKIDVHSFLKIILPPLDLNQNPFLPKDQQVVKKEITLAQVVEEMTGKRREVSNLNGPSHTRVESEFMQDLQNKNGQSNNAAAANKPAITLGYNNGNNNNKNHSSSAPSTPSYQNASSTPNYQSTFYSGTFNLAQTQNNQNNAPMSHGEQLQLAESLLHAMRDLPYLTQSPGSAPYNSNSADSSNQPAVIAPFSPQPPSKRPSTAPTHRVTHSAQTVSTPATNSEPYTTQTQSNVSHGHGAGNNNNNNNNNKHDVNKAAKSRPKSASATYRTSTAASETVDGKKTSALTAEDEYRLMQSQHLLAIAQAYAQFTHDQINGNDANRKNHYDIPSVSPSPASAKRPSSAPPSRGSHQLPFKHMKVPGREASTPNSTFGQSPRFIAPDTPRSQGTSSSNPSPRAMKFVNTGQHVNVPVSPYENNLQKLYQYTHRNIATTHEEYGLFVKNLSRATKMRQQVTEKQKDLRKTLGQTA